MVIGKSKMKNQTEKNCSCVKSFTLQIIGALYYVKDAFKNGLLDMLLVGQGIEQQVTPLEVRLFEYCCSVNLYDLDPAFGFLEAMSFYGFTSNGRKTMRQKQGEESSYPGSPTGASYLNVHLLKENSKICRSKESYHENEL